MLKRTTSLSWLTAMVALVAPATASAQEAVLSRYESTPAGDRFFSVLGANVDGHLVPRGQLTFDYQRRPFVLTDGAGNELAVPSANRVLLHASASLSIAKRVLVTLDAPFALAQSGDTVAFGATRALAPTLGAAVGELRVGARARLYGSANEPLQLAAGAFVYLPTATDAWGGEGYAYAQPTLQAGGKFGMFRYAGHLGAKIRHTQDPTSLTFGLGAGVSLLHDALFIGPEVQGSRDLTKGLPVEGVLDMSAGTAGEILLGGQYRFLKHFVGGVAAGTSFTHAIGSPEERVLVRLAYSPLSDEAKEVEPPPPPPDTDKDGFADPQDACPDKPGIASPDPAKNGCPAPPKDKDGDSIPDKADACVSVPGIANADPKKNGCPADTDEDGIYDSEDGCPAEAGSKDARGADRGCPDKDKDTIADRSDACVDVVGFPNDNPRRHGCPRAEVTDQAIVINQRIEFETDKANILEDSMPIIDAVATLLQEHPEIALLEVQGHADDMGEIMKNIFLSQNRAKAVVEALVKRGISQMRLTSKGFGSTKPLEEGNSDEARKKNRRVEFKIVLKNPALIKK